MKHLLKHKKLFIFLSILLVMVIFLAVKIHSIMRFRSYAYVQPYSDLKTSDDLSGTCDGIVTNDNAQSITLNSEKTIKNIYVKEGDTVKKGDKLFSYDSKDLENQLAAQKEVIASSQAQLDIKNKLLSYYKGLQTVKPIETISNDIPGFKTDINNKQESEKASNSNPENEEGSNSKPESREDSNTNPDIGEDSNTSPESLEDSNTSPEIGEGSNTSPEIVEGSNSNPGIVEDSNIKPGNETNEGSDSSIDDTKIDDSETDGISEEEKAELIKNTTADIASLTKDINSAKVDVQSLQQQIDDCTIKALVDGKVAGISDPNTSVSSGTPFITISSETGIAIKGYIDEFSKNTIKSGSKISAKNYISDSTSKGTVTYVSDYPSTSSDVPESTIDNVSYYEFIAFLKDGSGFNPDDSVSITFSKGKKPGILNRGYVRSDKKGTYCLVDRKGHLKKVYVKTSPAKYDSNSVMILEGLKNSDLIAFPYSKTGYAGNKTTRKAQETILSRLFN